MAPYPRGRCQLTAACLCDSPVRGSSTQLGTFKLRRRRLLGYERLLLVDLAASTLQGPHRRRGAVPLVMLADGRVPDFTDEASCDEASFGELSLSCADARLLAAELSRFSWLISDLPPLDSRLSGEDSVCPGNAALVSPATWLSAAPGQPGPRAVPRAATRLTTPGPRTGAVPAASQGVRRPTNGQSGGGLSTAGGTAW